MRLFPKFAFCSANTKLSSSSYSPTIIQTYKKQGYVFLPKALPREKAEYLDNSAKMLMKGILDYSEETSSETKYDKDENLYFSGGECIRNDPKEMTLTKNAKAILGDGIKALGFGLHNATSDSASLAKMQGNINFTSFVKPLYNKVN